MTTSHPRRRAVKQVLAALTPSRRPARGVSILIYHRVGGGTSDERDLSRDAFERQMDLLADHRVVGLDGALDALESGDTAPRVVLTFDDGFEDVHRTAWPLLRERGLPFTLYLTTGYVGGAMHWEGSTAEEAGPALTWEQVAELAASPLCTIANHTHTHPRPAEVSLEDVDRCTRTIRARLDVEPRHFAYTWGVRLPHLEPALRERFRSVATGEVGRNLPGADPVRLRRIPVRGSDPPGFFAAKLHGGLGAERAYAGLVRAAKALGAGRPAPAATPGTPGRAVGSGG